jgi:protein-S-isoprenylcysteine O-methyltransferase Ste14
VRRRLYICSEEEMMLESFGDAYREDQRSVPMLIPR